MFLYSISTIYIVHCYLAYILFDIIATHLICQSASGLVPVMGTAAPFTSGATKAATFSVAVAAAPLLFFVTNDKRQRRCFLAEKAAALQRPILRKYSAATVNNLLPRLFQFRFSNVSV